MTIIERARPEDAAALLTHLNRVGGETDNLTFGKNEFPASLEAEAAWLRERARSETSAHFVAREDGRIVGEAGLDALPRRMAHRAELGISVLRSHWGRGIGGRLLAAAVDFGRTHGIEMIELQVRSDNERAIGLYRKFGFERIGVYPGFFKLAGRYVDFDLMLLDLRGGGPAQKDPAEPQPLPLRAE